MEEQIWKPYKRVRVSTAADSVVVTSEVPPEEQPDEESSASDHEGLYHVLEPGKRQFAALSSGFLTDVAIMVGDEEIKCHTLILSCASRKLAAIVKEIEPRLLGVDPRHFRLLLEIIYTGGMSESQDVDTLLHVGRVAYKLKVHAAVTFCASSLVSKVDVGNLWRVMDFARLARDVNLARICLELICYAAGSVLQSEGFLDIKASTLELILKQNKLCDVTELQLFQACVAWSNAKPDEVPSRRAALVSALRLIRFRLLTAEEFSEHVCPTGLLSTVHERDILRSCVSGKNLMPEGFSRSTSPRDPTRRTVQIPFASSGKRNTLEQFCENVCTSLPLSVSRNTFILGVKFPAWRLNQPALSRYQEAVYVCLRDANSRILEEAMFNGEVRKGFMCSVNLKKPFEMIRNSVYSLEVDYFIEDIHTYKLYKQQTLKLDSGLQVHVLADSLAPPGLRIIAAYKLPA